MLGSNRRFCTFALAALLTAASATPLAAGIRVEAFTGQPWGVGRVIIDAPPGEAATAAQDDRFAVVERNGRSLYPVVGADPVGRVLNKFLPIELPVELPGSLQIYFLFRGQAPLELEVFAPMVEEVTVRPVSDPQQHRELIQKWWQHYARMYERVHREAEYPLVVQNYLTATWARRLGRPMPEPPPQLFRAQGTGGTLTAQLLADETYRAEVERDVVLGRYWTDETADQPLPPVAPAVDDIPAPEDGIEIEAIAAHVPQECYYLRFGNFPNYLWFRDFLNQWRGELANMLVMRSINRNIGPKISEQIALKESKLSRVLGPTVIHDVAIIGLDPYFRDGTAFGILFHAKNGRLLGNDFRSQRRESLDRHPNATDEEVKIAGREVSFLSTPNGAVRSYYAIDGDFHLVTNCRRLVERFYEVGQGGGALASAPDFRAARAEYPLVRDDTVFAHFSTAFLENLASPRYRIELDRRLRSAGEINVLKMAQLAANAEHQPAKNVDGLIACGLLPPGFGRRLDGSKLQVVGDTLRDSLRGTPGAFIPIADTPVGEVAPSELARYERFLHTLEGEAGRLVPLTAVVRRSGVDGIKEDVEGEIEREPVQLERIAVDVRLAPYSQTRLVQWADKLGPAAAHRLAPIGGNVASGEIVLAPLGPPLHLFAGVRDFYTPLVVHRGKASPAGAYQDYLQAYVGAWPRPGLLDTFLGPPLGPVDDHGFVRRRGLLGLLETWHRRIGDFFLFSFHRNVLQEVGPQLAMVQAERPAQIRVHVDNLADKQIAAPLTGLGYSQARRTSASASRFMNSLVQQLHVPRDDARVVAEQLIAGRFTCPLGGKYVVVEEPGGLPVWASTATPPPNRYFLTEIPADYQLPLLTWFRGLSADVARYNDAFVLHADLDMVPIPKPSFEEPVENLAGKSGWKLPRFDFLNMFGGTKENQPAEDANDTAEVETSGHGKHVEPVHDLPVPELLPAPGSLSAPDQE